LGFGWQLIDLGGFGYVASWLLVPIGRRAALGGNVAGCLYVVLSKGFALGCNLVLCVVGELANVLAALLGHGGLCGGFLNALLLEVIPLRGDLCLNVRRQVADIASHVAIIRVLLQMKLDSFAH